MTGWKKGRVGVVSAAESGTKSTNAGPVSSSTKSTNAGAGPSDHGGKSGAVVLVNRAAC